MSALRRLRNFWIPCVTTIVLGCFSDAVAQVRYQVEDLGTLQDGFFGCTMGVNNHGWTETQYGLLEAGKLLKGRVAINVEGFTFPLPTLGGPNNWDNPFGGEVNELFRNGCPGPERRGRLRIRHAPYVSCVSLAKGPDERSPDARRK